jgi:hypothetical protein
MRKKIQFKEIFTIEKTEKMRQKEEKFHHKTLFLPFSMISKHTQKNEEFECWILNFKYDRGNILILRVLHTLYMHSLNLKKDMRRWEEEEYIRRGVKSKAKLNTQQLNSLAIAVILIITHFAVLSENWWWSF